MMVVVTPDFAGKPAEDKKPAENKKATKPKK